MERKGKLNVKKENENKMWRKEEEGGRRGRSG